MFNLVCSEGHVDIQSVDCYREETLGFEKGPGECAQEREKLQKFYVNAYVEVSRQLAEFEELIDSTACEDAAHQMAEQRKKPLTAKVSSLSNMLTALNSDLQGLRPEVDDAKTAEAQLREQIKQIQDKCKSMAETETDLDEIKDVIDELEECPSTDDPHFSIPVWVGQWVTAYFDLVAKTDAEIDSAMNSLCRTVQEEGGDKPRAAETSEIEQTTIRNIPLKNTAAVPLLGTCPNCEGDLDEPPGQKHKSGHSRICWDPDENLNDASRRTDCSSSGKKAVLCVLS